MEGRKGRRKEEWKYINEEIRMRMKERKKGKKLLCLRQYNSKAGQNRARTRYNFIKKCNVYFSCFPPYSLYLKSVIFCYF